MNPFDELYADPLTAIVDKVKGLREADGQPQIAICKTTAMDNAVKQYVAALENLKICKAECDELYSSHKKAESRWFAAKSEVARTQENLLSVAGGIKS